MPSHHKRNTEAMRSSPRCRARTRQGEPCQSPAVKEKRVCRMHGGGKGSGAPKGNRNALKHGTFTRASFERRAAVRGQLQEAKQMIKENYELLNPPVSTGAEGSKP